jgi:hypothetical protein
MLTYIEGLSGTTCEPRCPRCRKSVVVTVPTLLTPNYSKPPASYSKPPV